MLNKIRLLLVLAAVGMSATLAQGGVIVFNTDTGQVDSIDGGAFGAGTSSGTCDIDTSSQLCVWSFTGNLVLTSGTTLQFVGSNRASVRAGDIIFGSTGGEAITISASSYTDASGHLVRGAGGGLGGAGGAGGVGGYRENKGLGGQGGEGYLPTGNDGWPATEKPANGAWGQ